jgi:hypothetical protein
MIDEKLNLQMGVCQIALTMASQTTTIRKEIKLEKQWIN